MSVLRHPLHLLTIFGGAASVITVLWGLIPSGMDFVAMTGGLIAFVTAIDLARRLGLEPSNDPAAPHNRKVR